MRLRIDPLTTNHIERVARAENRSRAEATRVLVNEAIRARHGRPPQVPVGLDDAGIRGATLACHCGGTILAGVQRFAEMDDRSLSAALRILLRDALRARGLMPSAATAPAPASPMTT
jgi:hypothetical protein